MQISVVRAPLVWDLCMIIRPKTETHTLRIELLATRCQLSAALCAAIMFTLTVIVAAPQPTTLIEEIGRQKKRAILDNKMYNTLLEQKV